MLAPKQMMHVKAQGSQSAGTNAQAWLSRLWQHWMEVNQVEREHRQLAQLSDGNVCAYTFPCVHISSSHFAVLSQGVFVFLQTWIVTATPENFQCPLGLFSLLLLAASVHGL